MTTPKVTVVIDSATINGVPFNFGYLRLTQKLRIPSDEDELLFEPSSIRVYFDTDGIPEVDLYPNDLLGPLQDDGSPGSYYEVYYANCPGDPDPWQFYLLSTNGDRQYLHVLADTPIALPGAISGDKNFTLEFDVTDSLTVTHNLGKKPSITVIDSAGDEVDVVAHYVNENVLIVNFLGSFGGTISCN